MSTIPYSQIKDKLVTGDLILFSGRYNISKLVERLEDSQWSHVAMVVRLPQIAEPLLWESTALTNLPDQIFHDNKTGPKIVDLKERLLTYGSDVQPFVPPVYAVRRLEVERTEEMTNALNALFTSLHGIPNPGKWKMIWEVVLGRFFNSPTKRDNYTCGAMIAESYIKMGLLKDKKVINGYMPKDFSTDGSLVLLKGKLQDELLININE